MSTYPSTYRLARVLGEGALPTGMKLGLALRTDSAEDLRYSKGREFLYLEVYIFLLNHVILDKHTTFSNIENIASTLFLGSFAFLFITTVLVHIFAPNFQKMFRWSRQTFCENMKLKYCSRE